jgi:hypothetical protein
MTSSVIGLRLRYALSIGLGMSLLTAVPANAATFRLFDSSLNRLPDRQGWISQAPTGSATLQSGAVVLNTSSNLLTQAGYAQLRPWTPLPNLNRTNGYTLTLTSELIAENHSGSNNRAGFSAIVIGSDRQGIELGFWSNRIWAQNVGFTQGEGVSFTTGRPVRYDLVVKGDRYCLFTDQNYARPQLRGPLRNYAAFGTPYNLANFLFLGDNTRSASATVKISNVTMHDVAIANCL